MEQQQNHRWYFYTIAIRRGLEDIYSGATNNVRRRLRQHNNQLKGGSTYCKRWGPDNAKLVLLVGPLPKTTALSIERYLKSQIRVGGGIRGRCQALMGLLQLPGGYTGKSARMTVDELKRLPVRCSLSRSQFKQNTGSTDEQLDVYKHISFDADFGRGMQK